MDAFFENPIALLFMSYGIGASITGVIQHKTWFASISNYNWLNDKWTKYLGVLLLGKIIIATPLRLFNPKLYLKGRPKEKELLQLKQDMDGAEVGHLIGFIVLLILCIVYIFIEKSWKLILIIFLTNIILNLYLVFLQQYNKRRVNRLLKIVRKF